MEFLELKNATTEITVWMSPIAEWEERKSASWKKKKKHQ